VEGGAPLLLPPTPILKEDNWPLLTVTKGFFENLAQQGAPAQSCNALNAWRQPSLADCLVMRLP
jgi:coatomer subunit alpha